LLSTVSHRFPLSSAISHCLPPSSAASRCLPRPPLLPAASRCLLLPLVASRYTGQGVRVRMGVDVSADPALRCLRPSSAASSFFLLLPAIPSYLLPFAIASRRPPLSRVTSHSPPPSPTASGCFSLPRATPRYSLPPRAVPAASHRPPLSLVSSYWPSQLLAVPRCPPLSLVAPLNSLYLTPHSLSSLTMFRRPYHLSLLPIVSHYLPLSLAALRYLSLSLTAFSYSSLPPVISRCLLLLSAVSRYLLLSFTVFRGLSPSFAASCCLSLPPAPPAVPSLPAILRYLPPSLVALCCLPVIFSLLSVASRCLSLFPVAFRRLPLSPTASCCLPLSSAASAAPRYLPLSLPRSRNDIRFAGTDRRAPPDLKFFRPDCEGLPGVYSTIWCLCYKTNELEKSGKKEVMGRAK
jgi:hypothetical protein